MLALPLALPLALSAGPAAAVVLDVTRIGVSRINGTDATATYNGTSTHTVALTGQVQLTTILVGSYADGARNGASVGLTGGSLVVGSLLSGGNPVAVTGVGGAASLAADGGTAGQVILSAVIASAGGVPTTLTANFPPTALNPVLTANTSQVAAVGYTVLDGTALDGVNVAGSLPGGAVAAFGVNGVLNTNIGAGVSSPGRSAGAAAYSIGGVSCTLASCSTANMGVGAEIGAGDQAAFLLRQELGGSGVESLGALLQNYAEVIDTQVFDCGVAGCTGQQIDWSFTLTSGDGAVFQVLQIVSSVDPVGETVPEPATLALLGFGLAGLAGARQRGRGRERA